MCEVAVELLWSICLERHIAENRELNVSALGRTSDIDLPADALKN
jgi:hypothetical protein